LKRAGNWIIADAMTSSRWLHEILAGVPEVPAASVDEWWARQRERAAGLTPVHAAIAGGAVADRLAWAFGAGYQAALRALVPDLPPHALTALCATEAGGAHPRAIATRLEGGTLTGKKLFITLMPGAELLLVVASEGTAPNGLNRLRLVRVPAAAPGVSFSPMTEIPFVPEIPHAEVRFEGIAVLPADVLPGDGYTGYLKVFRTMEDTHVFAAVVAYLLGVAGRGDWPRPYRERLASVLLSLHALANEPPAAPDVHVALSGALALGRSLIEESDTYWPTATPEARARWERDRPLFTVAERARSQRLEKAWATLRPAPR
jgi:acyl-CoA dehydrogenase